MNQDYNLPNRLPGEKVIKVLNRHKLILFFRFFMFCALAIIPLGFFLIMMSRGYLNILNDLVYGPVIILSTSGYYLFIWLLFFFLFSDYYLDVCIITNERIIGIMQKGFFSRTISEKMMSCVQDVTSEIKGVIPTLFNYGSIFIQTAGEVERFTLFEVPEAEAVRELVIKIVEEHQSKIEENNKQDNE